MFELLSTWYAEINQSLDALLGWVAAQPEGWRGWLVLMLIAFLAASVIPLGSEIWLITLLAAQWSSMPLLIVATIGNTAGAMTTYYLGRWSSRFSHRPLPVSRRWHWSMSRYQIFGSWTLLLSWMPLVGDIFVLIAGYLRTQWFLALILILTGKFIRYGGVIAVYLLTSGQQLI